MHVLLWVQGGRVEFVAATFGVQCSNSLTAPSQIVKELKEEKSLRWRAEDELCKAHENARRLRELLDEKKTQLKEVCLYVYMSVEIYTCVCEWETASIMHVFINTILLTRQMIAEAEAERTGRIASENEVVRLQKELKRTQQQLKEAKASNEYGEDDTQQALAESFAELKAERMRREHAEERLEAVAQWLVAQGFDLERATATNDNVDENQEDGGTLAQESV
jgi:hypothetical protein